MLFAGTLQIIAIKQFKKNLNMLYLIILFIALTSAAHVVPSTIVDIQSGRIEGEYVDNVVSSKPYIAFRGIPYAKPPVGKLRFQPPEEPEPWNGTLVTKTDGSPCVQKAIPYEEDTILSSSSEDCLYINVYTKTLPKDTKNDLKPVLVWIHGGAFKGGSNSGKEYSPEYLIDKDIVIVNMNYRLNVFGFLNTLDEAAPGNAGLKDQVAALRWVKNNIAKFGGDPNQVTIGGHSAGAASVQYLLQSELAKGLFVRAIIQSGSTLCHWATQKHPKEKAFKLGTGLGFNPENTKELINLLQTVDAETLLIASHNETLMGQILADLEVYSFVPSLEPELKTAFQSKPSYDILKSKNYSTVPVIMGNVDSEGWFLADFIDLNKIKNNLELLATDDLNIELGTNESRAIADEILKFYFKNDSKHVSDMTIFMKYFSQAMFIRGIRRAVEITRKDQDVYFYQFTFKSEKDNSTSNHPGVSHGDELAYLFYNGKSETAEEKYFREKFTTLWTNFIKTGNPTPEKDPKLDNLQWSPLSKKTDDATAYLDIGKKIVMGKNPDQSDFEFWKRIYNTYGDTSYV